MSEQIRYIQCATSKGRFDMSPSLPYHGSGSGAIASVITNVLARIVPTDREFTVVNCSVLVPHI